jgi:ribosomal protein S7
LLQNAEPNKASGLMSSLPAGLTDAFSDDDKKQFTTTQQRIPQEEVIEKISHECCHDNKEAAKKVYQESLNVLKEKTGKDGQGVLQDLLGSLTKV